MAKPGRKPGTPKTGGRKLGTPNRATKDLAQRLAEKMGSDWCPIIAIAQIAEDENISVDQRLRALECCASYLYARRRPSAAPEDMVGLEALVASAVSISVTAPATVLRPAASPQAALASREPSPETAATQVPPPPRPPLRLELSDGHNQVLTDYDPLN